MSTVLDQGASPQALRIGDVVDSSGGRVCSAPVVRETYVSLVVRYPNGACGIRSWDLSARVRVLDNDPVCRAHLHTISGERTCSASLGHPRAHIPAGLPDRSVDS